MTQNWEGYYHVSVTTEVKTEYPSFVLMHSTIKTAMIATIMWKPWIVMIVAIVQANFWTMVAIATIVTIIWIPGFIVKTEIILQSISHLKFLGPIHTSCCCRAEPIPISCGTRTAFSMFDSYAEPNLSNLITNQAKIYLWENDTCN